jgi:hypothetical protein
MTIEDIIRMAKEAGFYIEDDEANTLSNKEDFKLTEHLKNDLTEHLERFAKLVAEHERDECAKLTDISVDFWVKGGFPECAEVREAMHIGEAIRARKQA